VYCGCLIVGVVREACVGVGWVEGPMLPVEGGEVLEHEVS